MLNDGWPNKDHIGQKGMFKIINNENGKKWR